MARARKSLHKTEYRFVFSALRAAREEAGLLQRELGAKLGRPVSFVSDVELGLRRIDLLQAREWCTACGVSFPRFAADLDAAIRGQQTVRRP